MVFIIFGSLIGAVLGLRFKVFILIPTGCFALAIAAVDGLARGHALRWIAITMITAATSLQIGYLGGCVLRSLVAVAPERLQQLK
jgi:hypothetical protein